jgi:diacylglycerol kinase
VLKKFLNKLLHAIVGIFYSFRSQSSIRILSIAFLVIILIHFLLSIKNWIITILFMVSIYSLEMINTAIEMICNFVQPNLDPKIKLIKDVSAGAVFLICATFFIYEIIIILLSIH